MVVTIELSLYPLDNNYAQIVEDFIIAMKKEDKFDIWTNGMSTFISGQLIEVFPFLQKHFEHYWDEREGIFVMKIGKGELTEENIPNTLK